MSEIRTDPITGDQVIIAPERARRSSDFVTTATQIVAESTCPFCPGNEADTPPEVLAYRDCGTANQPGWRVRVIPNKYPSLIPNEHSPGAEDCGIGYHEVAIENPVHHMPMSEAPLASVAETLRACRERFLVYRSDPRIKAAVALKNHGPAAGATRDHPHMQLLGMPFIPPRIAAELDGAGRHFSERSQCIYCDIVEQECSAGTRLISRSDHFCVIAPYASRFLYEHWVIPARHSSNFEEITDSELKALGGVLKGSLARMDAALNKPAFNFILHSAPFLDGPYLHYHWHIEIMPKLTNPAGFEWGTGVHVNPVPPETAANRLRETRTNRHAER